jgi:hypothetical protein
MQSNVQSGASTHIVFSLSQVCFKSVLVHCNFARVDSNRAQICADCFHFHFGLFRIHSNHAFLHCPFKSLLADCRQSCTKSIA